jgi:hypothetical protein
MRGLAYERGNLETTEQQTVTQQEDKIIIIESSSPEIIYVPPYVTELNQLTHTIATRVAPYHVIFEPLAFMFRTNGMPRAQKAHDCREAGGRATQEQLPYRIAVGPQQGRKVFTLQTLPDLETDSPFSCSAVEVAGFSLHAGVATKANERAKLERLCRYITRPAVSTKRLSITRNGRVRYELKTPWCNGTTHVIFEPLDFISRLVALVPKPRVNLTRFHGVFAPNSKYRAWVTPARRGKRKKSHPVNQTDQTAAEKRASETWARRLKRVFNIEIETCSECGGEVRIIASVEDPAVIQKILAHLDNMTGSAAIALLPDCRASPSRPVGLFD